MKYALMAACAVIVSAPVSQAQDLSQFFSSYIAFGDSLTDDGKFAGTPFEPGLPSLGGRFSNGRTYAEIISDDFTVNFNFAIGGATARNENENLLPPEFGTFGGQVATFTGLVANPLAQAAVGAGAPPARRRRCRSAAAVGDFFGAARQSGVHVQRQVVVRHYFAVNQG